MEPPISPDAKSIRSEKTKLFESLRPILEADVAKYAIRGQYTGSKVRGEVVNGYREEEGVPGRFKNRNICGSEILYRQLALVWRALLRTNRKATSNKSD